MFIVCLIVPTYTEQELSSSITAFVWEVVFYDNGDDSWGGA